jgi:hypothetical protein
MILYIFLALTVLSLIVGMVFMVIGKGREGHLSSKFMMFRVLFQAICIICMYLAYKS